MQSVMNALTLNKKTWVRRAFARTLFVAAVSLSGSLIAAEPDYRSPSHLIRSTAGDVLYVAESTANTIACVTVPDGKIKRRYPCKTTPTGLTLTKDDTTLYVTAGGPSGHILVFDALSGKQQRRFKVGHSPTAPVLSKDQKTLYFCNRFDNSVTAIDTVTGKRLNSVQVKREPVSAILTPDGNFLLVVNHLPAGAANANYVAASISVISLKTFRVHKEIDLPNGSNGLRDIVLSKDGRYAYITHVLARYQLPTTQLERGWVNTNAISILDLETMTRLTSFLLDDIDQGAANPWGIALSGNGRILAATHAGSHEVSLIDYEALHKKIAESDPEQIPNDLSFLAGIRQRIKLKGLGPRSGVFVDDDFYTAQYFTDNIGRIRSCSERPQSENLELGPTIAMTEIRRGRMLFNDGSFCFQQWQSCTSCHPSERVDALNWDILNDGIGNPKNTKSLLYSHMTPPTTVTGCRANAETSVRAGIRFFMAVLPESDALAIDAFLKSMRPVPSPHLQDGRLSAQAKRGRAVFKKAKCGQCHSGPYYTDMKRHRVGTGTAREKGTAFDVPTLIEIWRTAPYLHDGRARTIKDVITTFNTSDEHGYTEDLSDQEIDDLTNYVLSL